MPEKVRRYVLTRRGIGLDLANPDVAEPLEVRSQWSSLARQCSCRIRSGWEELKGMIAGGLLIGFGIFFLGHFIVFWTIGPILVDEPSKAILVTEMVMAVAIIGLGIERWWRNFRPQ